MKNACEKSGAPAQNSVLAAAAGMALLSGEFLGINRAIAGSVIGVVISVWLNAMPGARRAISLASYCARTLKTAFPLLCQRWHNALLVGLLNQEASFNRT